MPRSLYNPSDIEGSIRKLSITRGNAFNLFYNYLFDPSTLQFYPKQEGRPHALKNLRSDLSTWRSALAQVPPSRLLTIPWLSYLAMTRADLAGRSDPFCIAALMEDLRLFTTQMTPEGLQFGSYRALGFVIPPLQECPSFLPATNEPQKTQALDAISEEEHRLELEERLRKLRREEFTLSTRSRIPAMANDRIFAELASIKEQIQSIEKELQS